LNILEQAQGCPALGETRAASSLEAAVINLLQNQTQRGRRCSDVLGETENMQITYLGKLIGNAVPVEISSASAHSPIYHLST